MNCSKCGFALQGDMTFCPKCGQKTGSGPKTAHNKIVIDSLDLGEEPLKPGRLQVVLDDKDETLPQPAPQIPGRHTGVGAAAVSQTSHAQTVGKNCPYCQTPFLPGADVISCEVCRMPHHRECWSANDGCCTTYGCPGQIAPPAEEPLGVPPSVLAQRSQAAATVRPAETEPRPMAATGVPPAQGNAQQEEQQPSSPSFGEKWGPFIWMAAGFGIKRAIFKGAFMEGIIFFAVWYALLPLYAGIRYGQFLWGIGLAIVTAVVGSLIPLLYITPIVLGLGSYYFIKGKANR